MQSIPPLCPYVRRAWYDTMLPGSDIPDRMIYDYELMYIKDGSAKIVIEGKSYIARQGDLFFFRPRQVHSITILGDKPLTQPHIHFDLEYYPDREKVPVSLINLDRMSESDKAYFRRDISEYFCEDFPSRIRPQSQLYLEQLIFDVIHAFSNPGAYQEIHLQWLFLRLWQQVLYEVAQTRHVSGGKRKNENLPLVKAYIERNLDRRVTLEDLSSVAHFNSSYLIRIFREEYGMSPLQYHMMLRMEKAKALIRFTNMPISEISVQLGFSTLQDFSRAFKRADGHNPTYYRSEDTLSDRQPDAGRYPDRPADKQ